MKLSIYYLDIIFNMKRIDYRDILLPIPSKYSKWKYCNILNFHLFDVPWIQAAIITCLLVCGRDIFLPWMLVYLARYTELLLFLNMCLGLWFSVNLCRGHIILFFCSEGTWIRGSCSGLLTHSAPVRIS